MNSAHGARRMGRRSAASLLVVFSGTAVVLASCSGATAAAPREENNPAHVVALSGCVTSSRLTSWTDGRLAMQTVAVPVEETSLRDAAPAVRKGAGGLLLFGASAPSDLGAQLHSMEQHDAPGNLGLLVMTDEEGGGVQRMANLVGDLPWPRWMAAHWTASQIEHHVAAVSRKMAAAGVNTDLAPVVDVDGRKVPPGTSDPDGYRSFGGKTSLVSTDGAAFARGLLSGGVVAVLKHFPGLGGASGNTDDEAAHTIAWSREKRVGLPPFVAGIRAGATAVMMSNATVPGLAKYPASLSPAAIGALTRTLHFTGLVMTDALSAVAISAAGFSVPAASVQALRAGADMELYQLADTAQETNARASSISAAIVTAVHDGRLTRGRLLAAARAVLVARHRMCPSPRLG